MLVAVMLTLASLAGNVTAARSSPVPASPSPSHLPQTMPPVRQALAARRFGEGSMSTHGTTVVIAVASSYPWVRYATFILPLRVHYAGDVTLLGDPPNELAPAVRTLCEQQRVRLVALDAIKCKAGVVQCPEVVTARFAQVATLCRGYTLCLSTDLRDVIFQADPFASLLVSTWTGSGVDERQSRKHDLVLSCEDDSKPIGASFFNAGWARKCYGESYLAAVRRKCIINSGTIFGSPEVFEWLAQQLTAPCPQTAEVFHGR